MQVVEYKPLTDLSRFLLDTVTGAQCSLMDDLAALVTVKTAAMPPHGVHLATRDDLSLVYELQETRACWLGLQISY